jgi:glycosyltransferase involved in cell wall biosynthesis
MNEKVSVIIPTYKRSEFLQRAVDSIIEQTYPNVEIVIVDDNDSASTYRVNTEKKIFKYIGFNNVLYIKNEKNLGGALARNRGISAATGDFITFLDDDDIYLPNKIKSQLEYMLQNEVDMSFTNVRIHNCDDKLIDFRDHSYVTNLENSELLKQHILHHLTPTSTYMYKREILVGIGGFDDIKIGQEFMLMLKTIESNVKIGYIPDANIIQYIHDGERISVGQNKIDAEREMFNFKKKYFKLLNSKQRRYVRFRHHAVMAVVGFRSQKYCTSLHNLMRAFMVSPLDFTMETFNYRRKLCKYKSI